MKTSCLFVAMAAVIAAGAFAGSEVEPKNPAGHEVERLQNQVNEMEVRIHSLEARLSRLESTVDQQRQAPPQWQSPLPAPLKPPSMLELPPTGRPPPEIWGERRINGWTFYVVPCETRPQVSAPDGSR